MSIEQIEDKAKNLVSSYPDDLEGTVVAELIQFAAFMRTQNPVTVNESAELIMFKLMSQTFPNVDWVAHLSVHDGVQCLQQAELLKVGNNQRRAAVLNAAGKAKLAGTYEH